MFFALQAIGKVTLTNITMDENDIIAPEGEEVVTPEAQPEEEAAPAGEEEAA